MQDSKPTVTSGTWLGLKNTKAMLFLSQLMAKQGDIKQILLLDDQFMSLTELRSIGVTKISVAFVLNNIIERTFDDTTVLYRLTPQGLKLKNLFYDILNTLQEVFNEPNISEIAKGFERPPRESLI